MPFYGFFQAENKFSKNLITLPAFSANKCPVFSRAENFKISVLCGKKKLIPASSEVKFKDRQLFEQLV